MRATVITEDTSSGDAAWAGRCYAKFDAYAKRARGGCALSILVLRSSALSHAAPLLFLGTFVNATFFVWETCGMIKVSKPAIGEPELEAAERSIWLLVGRRMRDCREQRGYPLDRIAEELAVPSSAYANYESGEAQPPALLLGRLAELLDVPASWFFQGASSFHEKDRQVYCDSPPSFRVATAEHRLGFLTDSFRKLDLEGQQHLLTIADALCRTNGERREK